MKDQGRTKKGLIEENILLKEKIRERERRESSNVPVKKSFGKSEEFFKAIIQNSLDVIIVVDEQANITYVSPSVERVLGYKPDELVGTRTLDLIAPDDKKRSIEDFRKALLIKESLISNDFHLKHKNGTERIMEGVGTNLLDNPNVAGFVMNARDITDRKMAEDALLASRAQLYNALEMAHLGHWEYDVADDLFIFNDPFYKIFRTTAEDVGGYTMRSEDYARRFVYPDDIDTVGEEIRKAIETTDPFFNRQIEHRMIYADGTIGYISVRFFIVKDSHGRTVKTYGVNQDITERKQVEAKLRQQTDAMDAAVDGMALLDEKGEYIYLNRAHVIVYGYESAEELIGKSWRALYDSEELQRFDQEIMPEFHRKGYWSGEAVGVKKDGSTFPQAVSLTAMVNGGLICVVRDITESKRVEESLENTLESLRKAFGATIQVMVAAVESRDPYTAGHQLRTANLARAIATEMGLSRDRIEGIRMAGSIHDIGKLSIPAEILSKPTEPTAIEFSLIKEHPRKGYEILKGVESPWPLAQIVYQHHERMDGSGYPRGLKGDEILVEARIMAVADVVEAMASNRPYRPMRGLNTALEEIEKNKGVLYDTDAVNACLRLFREKGFQLKGK
ncbi:MAG TPA: PAS domain S-box protein [Syntrophales bacterium]|nr:PAS domain S-box protein [Syntrophales bacterium]